MKSRLWTLFYPSSFADAIKYDYNYHVLMCAHNLMTLRPYAGDLAALTHRQPFYQPNTLKRAPSSMNAFSANAAEFAPNGIWARSFHEAGMFQAAAISASASGL
jgi:hypothetical protein